MKIFQWGLEQATAPSSEWRKERLRNYMIGSSVSREIMVWFFFQSKCVGPRPHSGPSLICPQMLLPTEKNSAYAMQVAVPAACGRRLLERLLWKDSFWSLHPDLQLFILQPAWGNGPFWVLSCHLPISALCHLPSRTRDRHKGSWFLAPHYHLLRLRRW